MRPLVESGQIQLGNHTVSHPDLTKRSTGAIQAELSGCGDFIRSTFGVEAAPYFRPPYGYLDAHVHEAAREIGYTQPVLWYGSLSDSGLITEEQVVQFAQTWFLAAAHRHRSRELRPGDARVRSVDAAHPRSGAAAGHAG